MKLQELCGARSILPFLRFELPVDHRRAVGASGDDRKVIAHRAGGQKKVRREQQDETGELANERKQGRLQT